MSSTDPDEPGAEPGGSQRLNREQLQARALRGVQWTLLHTLISIGLGFGINILLARVLGVTDFGRLAYLTTVIMIAGLVVELGLGMGVVQFGTKSHAVGDRPAVASLLSKAQGYQLLVIAPVVSLVVLAVVRADPFLIALAVVIGIWAKGGLGGAVIALTVENKTHRTAQNAMLVNLLTQVGVVITVLTIGKADAVWAARIVIGTLGVALALPYIHRSYRRALLRPAIPMGWPPGFWRYAIPAGLASILGNLVISRSEVLFLTWFDMSLAAGLYAAAFGMAGHIFSPAQALVGPLIPAISGLREVDPGALASALRRTLRASSTIVGLITAGGLAPVALLVPWIYGADYGPAAPAFVVLGLGAAIGTVGGPLFAFTQARLAGRSMLGINLAALFVNLGLIVALLPSFGLWGAVAANLSGILVRNGLLLVGELRDTGASWPKTLHDTAPLLVSAASCMAAQSVGAVLPWPIPLAAATSGLAGVSLFVFGLRVSRSGLTQADLTVVAAAVPTRLRRPAMFVLRMLSSRN